MTAEIAVLNKQAVALAADSAVTLSNGKIYYSAHKLFSLSEEEPIALMIYGRADLLQVPWETIVNLYKQKLGQNKFPTVKAYFDNFLDFVQKNDTLFPKENQDLQMRTMLYRLIHQIKNLIEYNIENKFSSGNKTLSEGDIETLIQQSIECFVGHIDSHHVIKELANDTDNINQQFSEILKTAIEEVLESCPLNEESSRLLSTLPGLLSSHFYCPTSPSGIVVTGFGHDQIFPALVSMEIETLINGKAKYRIKKDSSISFNKSALVIPFAQSDMIHNFMTGIDQDLKHEMYDHLTNELTNQKQAFTEVLKSHEVLTPENTSKIKKSLNEVNEDILTNFKKLANEISRKQHTNPVINIVESLQKEDLASMAEALINLTSFKRHVSTDQESVGGPIDVAVISKGDGMVWIKRKSYFANDLNPKFLNRCL